MVGSLRARPGAAQPHRGHWGEGRGGPGLGIAERRWGEAGDAHPHLVDGRSRSGAGVESEPRAAEGGERGQQGPAPCASAGGFAGMTAGEVLSFEAKEGLEAGVLDTFLAKHPLPPS